MRIRPARGLAITLLLAPISTAVSHGILLISNAILNAANESQLCQVGRGVCVCAEAPLLDILCVAEVPLRTIKRLWVAPVGNNLVASALPTLTKPGSQTSGFSSVHWCASYVRPQAKQLLDYA